MAGRRIRRPGGEVATRKAASRCELSRVARACRAAFCAARYSSSAGIPMKAEGREPVSYTHLTLPTNREV